MRRRFRVVAKSDCSEIEGTELLDPVLGCGRLIYATLDHSLGCTLVDNEMALSMIRLMSLG